MFILFKQVHHVGCEFPVLEIQLFFQFLLFEVEVLTLKFKESSYQGGLFDLVSLEDDQQNGRDKGE